jgi:hypothetical protein
MTNPTSNFNWQMPTNTDLVYQLPADFEVFGQAVDSTLADLKGGTSGQVLAKNSNTDMDFVWVAQDDSNAIQNTIVDAKGDLIGATAADTPARLAVGTNGQVLSADSTAATGLAWTTPAAGGSLIKLASNTFTAVSSFSLPTSTFSSTYRNYKMIFNIDDSVTPTGVFLRMRNAGADKTGASYYSGNWKIPYTGSAAMQFQTTGGTSSQILDSHLNVICNLEIGNPFIAQRTSIGVDSVEGNLIYRQAGIVTFLSNDSCDSLTIFMTGGTFTGRYTVYGYGQ